MGKNHSSELVLESNLQDYFYRQLQEFNKKNLVPLSHEIVFHSSKIMCRFGESHQYFEEVEGGLKEKALGKKLLESCHFPLFQQKHALGDIGDTALFLCGYFSESLNRKLTNASYYEGVGQMAYKKLNTLTPEVYGFENFYIHLSDSFRKITTTMGLVAQKLKTEDNDQFIILMSEKDVKIS